MGKELAPRNDRSTLSPADAERLRAAGAAADGMAARHAFDEYRADLTTNTLRAQALDLEAFAAFLQKVVGVSVTGDDLHQTPSAWEPITHGLIKAFVNWLLGNGYALGTVNRRLSTIRKYAALAYESGVLDEQTAALIKTVKGFSGKRARNRDEQRQEAGIPTRQYREDGQPVKKPDNVRISDTVAKLLKTDHEDTPQGRRDAVLMCLLLDHALRASEAEALTVGSVDLDAGTIRFYRKKTHTWQTDNLTPDSFKALRAYFESGDAPMMADLPLLRRSKKNGELGDAGLTARSISRIVGALGQRHGIEGLSAHDCRHSWATRARDADTPLMDIMSGGGWKTPTMVKRYTDERDIANEGVRLSS